MFDQTTNIYEDRTNEIDLLPFEGKALVTLRENGALLCACGATMTPDQIALDSQQALTEVGQAMRINFETGETGLVPIVAWVCPECIAATMVMLAIMSGGPIGGPADFLADGPR